MGDLFDLFFEEPLHELLAEVIALVAGDGGQSADLLGHGALQVECQHQRVAGRLECVAHGVDTGHLDRDVAVEQVLHQHHGVIAFLDRLAVKVLGQLRQVGAVEIHGDREVLLRRAEFAANLVVEQSVKFRGECVNRSHDHEDIAGQRPLSLKGDLTQASLS